jgi:hypothetical protein
MADVNGYAFGPPGTGEQQATLCLESRGREIVARIVNGAVERAMFGQTAETGAGTAAWQAVSPPAPSEFLRERD